MAENLVRAGFEVTVHDLKPELVDDLVALGAKSAATPRAVAEQSDIIASVVMNNRQTLEVFLEGDGTGVRWIHISSAIVRFSRNASAGVR